MDAAAIRAFSELLRDFSESLPEKLRGNGKDQIKAATFASNDLRKEGPCPPVLRRGGAPDPARMLDSPWREATQRTQLLRSKRRGLKGREAQYQAKGPNSQKLEKGRMFGRRTTSRQPRPSRTCDLSDIVCPFPILDASGRARRS
jgi:hypothetical protein